MTITEKSWESYIEKLRKVNDRAAADMARFLDLHRDADGLWNSREIRQIILEYAYSISGKYGDAAAELACEMYDSVGAMSDIQIPEAIPADTATWSEVAKTVNGCMKNSDNVELIASAVARLVKRTGVDTVMQNALRDGAEWAWVPHGETCPFCISLASRGWQTASKEAIKNGHAEHIHANCDCTYAVRFDEKTKVQGYDPGKYLRMYENAPLGLWNDGSTVVEAPTPKNRINAMRRELYRDNKEKINAQKREAYAKRTEE